MKRAGTPRTAAADFRGRGRGAPRRRFRSGAALTALIAFAAPVTAAPAAAPLIPAVEFGKAEVQRALAARGMGPERLRLEAVISGGAPESWSIAGHRITGGDTRGLMYGLLEAAEQIRDRGALVAASGSPAVRMRGIRVFIHNRDLEQNWYFDHAYWDEYFAMLARNRFNRFNLVFAHQTSYRAPPYPFWIDLPEFPTIRATGLSADERRRNLEALQYISQAADDHGIDFTLGIWEHNVQRGMMPTVEGLTTDNIGPYSHAALKKILTLCPAIRSVQMRTNGESGIPDGQQLPFYRDYVFTAIRDAGRPVFLDLRAWAVAGGMIDAAIEAGVPVRVSTKYWAEDLGRPYQPAETFPGYSYLNFLQQPLRYAFYWELWGLGSHRLLLWGDPDYVKRAFSTFGLGGASGFEIDPPLAQKGFGNRPGKWGVFTAGQAERVFWRYEFERYWLFYALWGRLSYDPSLPDSAWLSELNQRFGRAAGDVMDAYRESSHVINEIVASHLADPNMYLWPEINPGGLLDDYRDVLPSDWRFIASIPEAVANWRTHTPSAKQTPFETADRLNEFAQRTERAVARAAGAIASDNKEWQSSAQDFSVLALLARYHAQKQLAALAVTWFDQTADAAALASARDHVTQGLAIWERLAALTDGVYPQEMAFGPDDVGHWKDRLPYVRHDLELIREREDVLARFGSFEFGFDFGGAVPPVRNPAAYRATSYVLRNTVEPRFIAVDPATMFDETVGYGWAANGPREAVPVPPASYLEVRSAAANPQRLPRDVLFRDYIRGRGAQDFLVRTAGGDFTVLYLHPDRSASPVTLHADAGMLRIPMPAGEWSISGLVVKRASPGKVATVPGEPAATAMPHVSARPRPSIAHDAPSRAVSGQPLSLSIRLSPSDDVTGVRIHYRPVNQLARFKTIEQTADRLTFTIPGEDISNAWGLMYYFEVLNAQGSGWFQPDPLTATPYYVVDVR